MIIAIRKETNGAIYIDSGIERHKLFATPELLKREPYNYKLVSVPNDDITDNDFNENLEFDVVKYNARKTKEQNLAKIIELKKLLSDSDYKALKHMEGFITDDDYEPIKKQRQQWREMINKLEK